MKACKICIVPALLLLMAGCSSKSPMGERVKEPFSGSKYESNNRFFRATGKGTSSKSNIARGKADIEAKNILAAQINSTMRSVTDQYLAETSNDNASDIADKFQSLSRQVVNTNMADLRKIGEEKYYDGTTYTVYIAYEIHKNSMFRFMKKQARTDARIDARTRKAMEDILDRQIAATEE
jgi:hypothetical protein